MHLNADFHKHILQFITPMGTSRGVLTERTIYLIHIQNEDGIFGIGECSPVPGLSCENPPDFIKKLHWLCRQLNENGFRLSFDTELRSWPAIRFGLEAAVLDLQNGGQGLFFDSPFSEGTREIPINGLINMGSFEQMLNQLRQKAHAGFKCIKIKVGALDFKDELAFLQQVRHVCPADRFELRLDANGAFHPDEALNKLEQLAQFEVHSIEQPIKTGQLLRCAEICRYSPIPIVLDEELIGVLPENRQRKLLETIRPNSIIIKPTLLGGFAASKKWIDLAASLGIQYWVASILESNIGLSAIAQWTGTLHNDCTQGLGTGQLFRRNFRAGVYLENGALRYNSALGQSDRLLLVGAESS